MRILAIAAHHHASAAVLLVDGHPVAAGKEEQYTRVAGDDAFPSRAIQACLAGAGLRGADLDQVVFHAKPLRAFERTLAVQLQWFPRSARSFAHDMFRWLGDRLWIKNRIARELAVEPSRVLFVEHQSALAAAAFYPSPFEAAAVLTLGDVGEWATTGIATGQGDAVRPVREIHFPDSLGRFADAITQFLGFEPIVDAAKVEDLAGLGEPTFAADLGRLVPSRNGGFRIDTSHFRFPYDEQRLWHDRLTALLGPPRYPGEVLAVAGADRRHADIAASLQVVLQDRAVALAEQARELTGCANLCIGGRLAGNRRLVTELAERAPFERVFIPAATDTAGAALGAALLAYRDRRPPDAPPTPRGAAAWPADLGIDLATAAADPAAATAGLDDPLAELHRRLLDGERVAWVRGTGGFGDQTAGRRSVLALPDAADAGRRLLAALQRSEPFLACPLALTAEFAAEVVAGPAADNAGRFRVPAGADLRRAVPGAVAADGTVWPVPVAAATDPEFHALLAGIGATTGSPALLAADFALRGACPVGTEADAVAAFARSSLDALIADRRLYVEAS